MILERFWNIFGTTLEWFLGEFRMTSHKRSSSGSNARPWPCKKMCQVCNHWAIGSPRTQRWFALLHEHTRIPKLARANSCTLACASSYVSPYVRKRTDTRKGRKENSQSESPQIESWSSAKQKTKDPRTPSPTQAKPKEDTQSTHRSQTDHHNE